MTLELIDTGLYRIDNYHVELVLSSGTEQKETSREVQGNESV